MRSEVDQLAGLMAGEAEPLPLSELLDRLRPAWMRDALCREYSDVDFFPGRGAKTAPAKSVCRSCLVRAECLAYALEWECVGVWAGTSEQERRRARRAGLDATAMLAAVGRRASTAAA